MSKKIAQKCSVGNNETTEQKYRSYCFTSFEEDKPPMTDKFKFLCFSPEVCPTTKRHHWQGYIYLKNQMTKTAINKYMLKNFNYQIGNLTVCKGTAKENMIYCGKEDYNKDGKTKVKNDLYEEFGEAPKQGERTDLEEIKDEILNGKKLDDIIINNPLLYHQYGRTLSKIEAIALKKKFRTWMTEGIWYYGKTGVGKSHLAFEGYNPETHYLLNQNDGGFWQGYTGQEIVIINEFRGEIKFSELLAIVDKWPHNVKIKGSECYPLLAKKVIITSCKSPKEVYTQSLDDEERLDQLERRFKIIKISDKK